MYFSLLLSFLFRLLSNYDNSRYTTSMVFDSKSKITVLSINIPGGKEWNPTRGYTRFTESKLPNLNCANFART